MVKRFILIAASIVLPVCLILTSCRQGAGKKAEDVAQEATEVTEEEDLDIKYAAEMLTKGTQAPSFTLKDINGNDVSLEAFKGKYVVLDFWASWCPDCRKDVPAMKALCEKYSSDKVAFLGVSFDTDKDQWTGFVKENGMEWTHVSPMIKWKESQVSQDYKVNWIPSMYLIDPDGKIVFGTVVLEKLEKALASL
ncbi:MAG: TlpA family protein disulfide reductase [Bacteroidales bacterium]|nr:TlpA family protein disulfide reductase [Bacteroidales bacterium]